ncbi:MAG: hypothetical protein R3B07_07545 [Polyangiaceae bacterium]
MSDSSPDNNRPDAEDSPHVEPEASAAGDNSLPEDDAAPEDDTAPEDNNARADAAPESSAVDDLTQGLGLMFRAAKKAVMGIDPQKIETMGREAAARATREVERLDKDRVTELGKKAAENLRPEKIEAFAEDAGRELVNVVERVADRVEQVLGVREPGAKAQSNPPSAPPAEEAAAAPRDASPSDEPPARVRVDD